MPADAYRNTLDAALHRIEVLEASRTMCVQCEARRRRFALAWRLFVRTIAGLLVALLAAVIVAVTLFAIALSSLSGPWPGAS